MKQKLKQFTDKHAEIWKFIKFTFTGVSTSVLELAVFMFLQYVVFRSLNAVPVTDNPILSFLGIEYQGYLYSYAISATIGYAAAYIMNRKITFQADANPVLSTILYAVMVVCTIAFNTWFGAFLGTLVTNSGYNNVFVEMLYGYRYIGAGYRRISTALVSGFCAAQFQPVAGQRIAFLPWHTLSGISVCLSHFHHCRLCCRLSDEPKDHVSFRCESGVQFLSVFAAGGV